MGFYEQISKYYDYIFPTEEPQLEFIKEAAGKPPKKLLDIACGSGGYSAALAKAGYRVTAIDLDEKMVEMARMKKEKENLDITAMVLDMLEISKGLKNESFDLAFCIGNSIVHLGSKKDILSALVQMKDVLKACGTLILQIINFDRVFKYNITNLPTLINEEIGLKFVRNYSFNKDTGLISFNTHLTVNGAGGREEYENTIELLPLLSKDMLELLKEAGYKNISFYGDFNGSAYTEDSYLLVVRADV